MGHKGFGVYVHVPFCARRCGYCDFNTYTSTDGVEREGYIDAVLAELDLMARVLDGSDPPLIDTVFFGGGTPTLLAPDDLGRVLARLGQIWGLAPDAEITTEANPETVDLAALRRLRAVGFTRISLGAQSTAPHVLAVLDRQHQPERATTAVADALAAGFEHVNLDLIYGTPGESAADFAGSLRAVIDSGADHVSAYALVVEDGTQLATRIRRGEVAQPDDDVAADRYLAADQILTSAGFDWYEISNWARSPAARCRHNLGYWHSADWIGLGPGSHSHIGGVRWWNVKHPATYRQQLAAGVSPGAGREILTATDRHVETVLLRLRLADGLPARLLVDAARSQADAAVAQGLLAPDAWARGRAVLTTQGRLLTDAVVRRLLP